MTLKRALLFAIPIAVIGTFFRFMELQLRDDRGSQGTASVDAVAEDQKPGQATVPPPQNMVAERSNTSGASSEVQASEGLSPRRRPEPGQVAGPPFFVAQERVRYASGSFDNGYVLPDPGYELLIAFVQRIAADTKVSADSLRWKVRGRDGKERESIGFAASSGPEANVGMFGALTEGNLSGFVGGTDPFLGVVFVVAKNDSVLLLDPAGKTYRVPEVRNWKPKAANSVRGFQVGGTLNAPIEGENWKSGFK